MSETVKVVRVGGRGFKVINASEFNKAKHVIYVSPEEKAEKAEKERLAKEAADAAEAAKKAEKQDNK